MIKILIIVAVGYLLYRSMRSWMFPHGTSLKSGSGKPANEIDDVMIKDPYCQAYFPRRDAVHLSFRGNDLYFCSEGCREKYVAHQSEAD
jgi:YHS domain-containing protein